MRLLSSWRRWSLDLKLEKYKMKLLILIPIFFAIICAGKTQAVEHKDITYKAGDRSLQIWLLPDMPEPENNLLTPERVELGKVLFFDPRLSGDKNMSCATCHNPSLGWSDALPKSRGRNSQILGRATPTIINSGYNTIQMWDGRKKDLEDQAIGPMETQEEMHSNIPEVLEFLVSNDEYRSMFAKAYPSEIINEDTLTKALASFERTVVSDNSPFDRWVKGDAAAMTSEEVNGFKVFMDPQKGNCSVCHAAPNFTDDGFHNIGLASFGNENPDLGRYNERPLRLMKGAFKTPTLRDVALTGPYFHDGSAQTLAEVVEHYVRGGEVKTNLSPNFTPSNLDDGEISDLVAFMRALTSPRESFDVPALPIEN